MQPAAKVFPPTLDGAITLDIEVVVDDAIRNGANLWIKYRNKKGEISEREITPKSRDGSLLLAYCHTSEMDLNFALRGHS